MTILKAFRGWRPLPAHAAAVASRPYDVLDSDEARIEADGNPLSFLHVVKPEIDLPVETDHYSPLVYEKGRENFQDLVQRGVFVQDRTDSLYIYRLTMDGRSQTGIVGCAAVDDYFNDIIKKHELTRTEKEEDRMNHIRVTNMNAEPVFFTYRSHAGLDGLLKRLSTTPADADFVAADGIRHEFWVVADDMTVGQIIQYFVEIPVTYVADGHHRTAAAAKVGRERQKANPNHTGNEEYNFFLAVHFPDNQLSIFDYNRVVQDLNGLDKKEFLVRLGHVFKVEFQGMAPFKPRRQREFGMYLDGGWYSLKAKDVICDDTDPIASLDVTVLSKHVLADILGIHDLRKDKRIDFIGGIRGLNELERRVNSGEMKVAFALYPVSMQELMLIADSGQIMPPKTTWFEPKLRSGLVVHGL